VEGSAHVLNPKKKVSKSANEWPAYTLLPGRRIVTNGSGLSHQVRVRVRVHTESLPYWCSGLSIPLNLQLGYSSIEISLPHLNVPGCQQVAQRVHLSIQRRLLCLQFDNCALSKSRIQQALIYFRVFCGSQYWLFWKPCFSFDIIYFCLSRWSVVLLCVWISVWCIHYQMCKNKNCWSSIDAHFQNVTGSMSPSFLPIKTAAIALMDVYNQSKLRLPKMQHKHSWLSIDSHSQYGAVTMLLALLPKKAANPYVMSNSNPITIQLPYLQHQKSLTLHWPSFSECGRECVGVVFANNGCQCRINRCLQPIGIWITQHSTLNIVDVQFMLTFKMWQGAWGCWFCKYRLPLSY